MEYILPWQRALKDPSLVIRGTEIFVGNLSFDITEEELFNEFREFGEIIDVIYY